jgi:hypothetical protein
MTRHYPKRFLLEGKIKQVSVKMGEMLRYQESKLAVGFAWLLAPLAGMLGSFYIATVFYTGRSVEDFHRDQLDLQPHKVIASMPYGLAGLIAGIILALVVTMVYPKYVDREYRLEEELHGHH